MREVQKNSVLVATLLALALPSFALPSFALADAVPEPISFESEPDGADVYVQLDINNPDEGADDTVGKDDSGLDVDLDPTEDNLDQSQDVGADAGDENYVADDDDGWVTPMGDTENPIYFEFDAGGAPADRDDPAIGAPADGLQPTLAALDDVTLGINVHNKAAVAAQCADLQQLRQTYHAFYKLYCN